MTETVPAAEFARDFGRYEMQAQREAAPVSSNGALSGYFVAPHDYEELRKLKTMRRRFPTAELSDAEAEQIASSYGPAPRSSEQADGFAVATSVSIPALY